jgi:hypothetical protein
MTTPTTPVCPATYRHEPSYRYAMSSGFSDALGVRVARGTCACGVEVVQYGSSHRPFRPTTGFDLLAAAPVQGAPTEAEAELIESQAVDLAGVEGADPVTLRANAEGRHGFEARVLARAAELVVEDRARAAQITAYGAPLVAGARTSAEDAGVVRHPFGVGRAAPDPSTLLPAPGGCTRCRTAPGPRNVHAGWCPDAEVLRAAPAFDEADPATWSVPTGHGNEVIENLPAGYAWVPVVGEDGDETGELHLWSPDGRDLSLALFEAEIAAGNERRAALLAAEDEVDELEDDRARRPGVRAGDIVAGMVVRDRESGEELRIASAEDVDGGVRVALTTEAASRATVYADEVFDLVGGSTPSAVAALHAARPTPSPEDVARAHVLRELETAEAAIHRAYEALSGFPATGRTSRHGIATVGLTVQDLVASFRD